MPMENNLQLDNLMKEGTFPVESVGGDRWRILHGDTLQLSGEPGWQLLVCQGHVCGWGKLVGQTLKNFYPKGLRF